MVILYFVPFCIYLGVLLANKYKFEKNDFINTLFLGVLTTIGALIVASLKSLSLMWQMAAPLIYYIVMAAIPEELVKFIAIKLSKPKTKDKIFVNAIIISFAFIILENLGYYGEKGSTALLSRILTPMHLLFQLIMAAFLVLAFKEKEKGNKGKCFLFNVLALVIPILCHGLWDALAANEVFPRVVFYIGGIITYGILFAWTLKIKNEEEITKSKLKVSSVIKSIIIILFIAFFVYISNPNYIDLNTETKIEHLNFYITVEGSEAHEEQDDLFDFFNGSYTKVKVKVKNDNDTDESIDLYDFVLYDSKGEKVANLSFFGNGDDLDSNIAANSENEGYIYFEAPYNKEYILEYSYRDLSSKSAETHKFKISE